MKFDIWGEVTNARLRCRGKTGLRNGLFFTKKMFWCPKKRGGPIDFCIYMLYNFMVSGWNFLLIYLLKIYSESEDAIWTIGDAPYPQRSP